MCLRSKSAPDFRDVKLRNKFDGDHRISSHKSNLISKSVTRSRDIRISRVNPKLAAEIKGSENLKKYEFEGNTYNSTRQCDNKFSVYFLHKIFLSCIVCKSGSQLKRHTSERTQIKMIEKIISSFTWQRYI